MFGLDVRGDFPVNGLDAVPAARPAPQVAVELANATTLDAAWEPSGGERLVEWPHGDDVGSALVVDRSAAGAHRIVAEGYGDFLISARGTRITCAPADVEPWQWQRYLIGQLLPLTAVLNGREVLHASAVSVGDDAIAFVAGSGVGKTSVALNLVLRGAGFLTDDVVALGWRDGLLEVQPGPGLTNLRAKKTERMGTARRRVGELLGRDEHGLRVRLRRDGRALPLRAIYLLERAGAGGARIDPAEAEFSLLFKNGFDFLVDSPRRMRNQLDVFAALARQAALHRVQIGPAVDARGLAAAIEAHAGQRFEAAR